jgi:hypothetical protein
MFLNRCFFLMLSNGIFEFLLVLFNDSFKLFQWKFTNFIKIVQIFFSLVLIFSLKICHKIIRIFIVFVLSIFLSFINFFLLFIFLQFIGDYVVKLMIHLKWCSIIELQQSRINSNGVVLFDLHDLTIDSCSLW